MNDRSTIETLLPGSLVFPKEARALLLRQLSSMTQEQVKELATILREEKEAMETLE